MQYTPAGGDSVSCTLTYAGNVTYRDGEPDCVLFDEGYIDLTGTAPQYRFFVTDHLGSVRAVVNLAAGTVAERDDYMAYGTTVPNLDFGARIYYSFTVLARKSSSI